MSSTRASQNDSGDGRSARSDRRRRATSNWVEVRRIEHSAGPLPIVPPSEYSSYVGRVAGLAVALGVGAAIASMPAVAFADTTGSGGSAASSSSSSSPEAGTTSGDSSADSSDSSEATDETTSSASGGSSFGPGSEAAPEKAADEAADVDDADIDIDIDDADVDVADVDDADVDADDPTEATPDTGTSDDSNSDIAITDNSGSDGDAGTTVADSPADVDSVDVSVPVEVTAGSDGSPAAALAADAGSAGAAPPLAVDETGAGERREPPSSGPASTSAARAVGTAAAASAASATADAVWLFGNGTAAHPNGGVLFGSGFSFDASTCAGSTACDGGSAGLWGGSGGNGFNGGDGGSAGWFGNGGNGGDGVPGGNGGNGGRGGVVFGKGGDGGAGGAALAAGDAPGRGGDGGNGGLFGTNGRAGSIGAAFPTEATPPTTVTPSIAFDFVYGAGAQHWSSAARSALEAAAQSLSSYFVVTSPVTLTYDVSGENSPRNSTLAWASSPLSGSASGFFETVVQEKTQSGVDSNGNTADAKINFNFGQPWSLGSSAGVFQYDFQSTAMHELLHTFGFISNVDSAGSNTARDWTLFDSFIVNSGDANVIGSNLSWNSAYNPNLTGGNGGLYFGGPNAVAEYGGLVPLYTPNKWADGSSVSHLDSSAFKGANSPLLTPFINTGPGLRILSPIELAILEDLGYTVGSPQQTSAFLFFAILLVRRRRTN